MTREVHITLMLGKGAMEDTPAHHVIETGPESRGYWRIDRDRNLLVIRLSPEERFEYPIENLAGWHIRSIQHDDPSPEPGASEGVVGDVRRTAPAAHRDRTHPAASSEPRENFPGNTFEVPTFIYGSDILSKLDSAGTYRVRPAKITGGGKYQNRPDDIVVEDEEEFSSGILVWLI